MCETSLGLSPVREGFTPSDSLIVSSAYDYGGGTLRKRIDEWRFGVLRNIY